jgi:demethylmenaquinone methyltransferase/2-methoxy-6-polyprenyl-1,4-benzoquinol methylase
MFDAIAPRYDLLNTLMTFGLDRHWRKRTIELLASRGGERIVDLAAGTGGLGALGVRRGLRPVAVDLSFAMLAAGGPRAARALQGDASALPIATGSVDGLVSGFALRNFAALDEVFSEAARVLRTGGRVALLEVDTPRSRLLRFGHRIWFTGVVPRLGALLSDAAAYRYLPRSVAYLPPGDELVARLEGAGFASVERHRLTGGIVQVLTATRAGGTPELEPA